MAKTGLYNVAVIPPPRISAAIVNMSKSLSTRGGVLVIDGETRHPHLTLYMARFESWKRDLLARLMGDLIVNRLPSIDAVHSGFMQTAGRYFEASYVRTPTMVALPERVVSTFAGERSRPGKPDVEAFFAPFSPPQRASAERTGYDLAGPLFRPHISISRFAVAPSSSLAEGRDLSFEVSQIGLFEADQDGSATRLICTSPVGPAAREVDGA